MLRRHAGLQPGRVRPHAAGESGRRPRPLAAVLHRVLRRRRRAGRPRRRGQRSDRRRAGRSTGGAGRRRGDDLPQPGASTWRPTCPARPVARFRWSTLDDGDPRTVLRFAAQGTTGLLIGTSMMHTTHLLLVFLAVLSGPLATRAEGGPVILPRTVALSTPESSQQLIVQLQGGGSFGAQWREGVEWSSSDAEVAVVSAAGLVQPVGNGQTEIRATMGEVTTTVPVTVTGMQQPFRWSFRNHVQPVLAKTGCNSGACHGALAGKGGFRLSLRGYDPTSDHFNIVKQDRGRRVEFADPGRSLVLSKPSGALPHKGGLRFETDSPEYRILSEWIAEGGTAPTDEDPVVASLEILPERSTHAVGGAATTDREGALQRRAHGGRHSLGEMVFGQRGGRPGERSGGKPRSSVRGKVPSRPGTHRRSRSRGSRPLHAPCRSHFARRHRDRSPGTSQLHRRTDCAATRPG